MKLPVLFRPEALDDSESTQQWYESQKAGLGERFARALTKLAELIGQWPYAYAPIWKSFRAAKVKGFPYVLYYRVHSKHIEVMAVLHGSSADPAWKARLSP